VRSVRLGIEDHGILTMWLDLDFGGTGQGFCGPALDVWSKEKDRRVGHACGSDFILEMLRLFGVDDIQDIKGRYIIALREERNGLIKGLKTPSVDGDHTFILADWQKQWEET